MISAAVCAKIWFCAIRVWIWILVEAQHLFYWYEKVEQKKNLLGSSGKDDEKEERKTESEDKKEQKKEKKKKKEDLPALTAGPQLPPQIDDDSIGKPCAFYLPSCIVYSVYLLRVGLTIIAILFFLLITALAVYCQHRYFAAKGREN